MRPRPAQLGMILTAGGRLPAQLAHALDRMGLRHSWFAYIPSQLAKDRIIDTVAKAVLSAHDHCFRRDEATAMASTMYYAKAVTLVRETLSLSDEALLSVALLALFERLVDAPPDVIYQHMQGLAAIVLARPQSYQMTEITRAILHAASGEHFRVWCGRGLPSPFEQARWLDFDSVRRDGSTGGGASELRKLSHQLMMRLPRLQADVRACRLGVGTDLPTEQLESAAQLARELSQLRDEDAENDRLHHVRVVPTKETVDRAVMACSYDFRTYDDMEAACLYWQARLMVMKLQRELSRLQVPDVLERPTDTDIESGEPYTIEFIAEETRLVANLIMSFQEASKPDVLNKDLLQGLIVIWGALAGKAVFRKMPASVVRTWTLQQVLDILPACRRDSQAAMMDETSDWLAGGLNPGMLRGLMQSDSWCRGSYTDPGSRCVLYVNPQERRRKLGSLAWCRHCTSTPYAVMSPFAPGSYGYVRSVM